MNQLLNAGLVVHICGISLMVGMTIAGFATHRQLFILSAENKNGASTLIATARIFSRLQMFGGLLIITGGVMMMIAFQGLIAGQLWFKVKLSLLLLLVLNMALIFRPADRWLRRFFKAAQPEQTDLTKAQRLLNRFYILQFLIFLGIFILSVFRFN
jgi:uncharacterized membrane protein